LFFQINFFWPKDLRGKFHSPRLHNIAQFPRLLVRQQQRAFVNPNQKQHFFKFLSTDVMREIRRETAKINA